MNYKDPAELRTALTEITESQEDATKPSVSIMIATGCINYQLGNTSLAINLLKQAQASIKEEKDKNLKGLPSGALILIFLKTYQTNLITKAYIKNARQHSLGRWALVLYSIELYRQKKNKDHLLPAISELENKIQEEGSLQATNIFLDQLRTLKGMEDMCQSGPPLELGAEAESAPPPPNCEMADLEEYKNYVLSTAYGLLSKLLKEAPFFNNPS